MATPMLPLKGLQDAAPQDTQDPTQDPTQAGGTMTVPAHPIYQSADQGPFRCDNCEYFTAPSQCSQPQIIQLQKGVVEPGGCCDYFSNAQGGQQNDDLRPTR